MSSNGIVGACLGAFWLIANPLLMLALYVFAFGLFLGVALLIRPDESTLDYALGIFLGSECVRTGFWDHWGFSKHYREPA